MKLNRHHSKTRCIDWMSLLVLQAFHSINQMAPFHIPFQSILPLAIITGVLAGGAAANKFLVDYSNDGVPRRHGMDLFEKKLLERDRRLVGNYAIQRDDIDPPDTFYTNAKAYLVKY